MSETANKEGFADCYPKNTSHYKSWIAASRSKFLQLNKELSESAWAQAKNSILQQANGEELLSYTSQRIDPSVEEDCLRWVKYTSIEIWNSRNVEFRVLDTAMALFNRYYLKKTVIDAPPQVLIITALLVASKIENSVPDMRPKESYLGEQDMKLFDGALKLEYDLIATVNYDFRIVHGDTIISHYVVRYFRWRLSRNDFTVPASWHISHKPHMKFDYTAPKIDPTIPMVDDRTSFERWIDYLTFQLQCFYLLTHLTKLHFYTTPSMLSLAIFQFYLEGLKGMQDIPVFLETTLSPDYMGNEHKIAQIKRHVDATIRELAVLYDQLPGVASPEARKKMVSLVRVLKKIGKLPSGKRDAPESGHEPENSSKISKVET